MLSSLKRVPKRNLSLHRYSTSTSSDQVELAWKNKVNLSVDLGEGAIWDRRSARLFWIDIIGKKLMSFNPKTGRNDCLDMPSYIGTVVPRKSGGMLVATQSGIGVVRDMKDLSIIAPAPFSSPLVRFNDGKCDPRGRFFVGSMLVDTTKVGGALWRFDSKLKYEQVKNQPAVSNVFIPNGIVWSKDEKHMYWTDTMTYRIFKFDYDAETGSISNQQTCFEVAKETGMPDGITMDAEGNIWVAHWDGYQVTKWDPSSGKLLHTVHVCTGRPSAVAFGGPDLTDLYITTACFPPGHGGVKHRGPTKRDDSLAGSLFVVRGLGKGVPAVEFTG